MDGIGSDVPSNNVKCGLEEHSQPRDSYLQPARLSRRAYMRPMSPIPMMPTDTASMLDECTSAPVTGFNIALSKGKELFDAVVFWG